MSRLFLDDLLDDDVKVSRPPPSAVASSSPPLNDSKKLSLYNYQTVIVKKMRQRDSLTVHGIKGGILAAEMGLGKTIMAIEHALQLYTISRLPSLIVCSNILLKTWEDEIKKYCNASYVVYHKTFTDVTVPLSSYKGRQLIVTSYEMINMKYNINELMYNCIYLDESHRIANPKSKIFENVSTLKSKICKWCLSGSPIKNYTSDIVSQFKFLGYNQSEMNETDYDEVRDCIIRLMKTDVKDEVKFPDVETKNINLELSETEREIYNVYRNHSNDIYRGFVRGKYSYGQLLGTITKLCQLVISPCIAMKLEDTRTDDEEDEESSENDKKTTSKCQNSGYYNLTPLHLDWIRNNNSTKINEILKIVNSIPKGEKCLIFTRFKGCIKLIKKLLSERKKCLVVDGTVTGKKRYKAIDDFKTEDVDVFIIQNKVGGEGLTLVEANHVIIVENWWCPSVIDQCCARVIRPKQNKKVFIYKLMMTSTIEERIEETCNMKRELTKTYIDKKERIDSTMIRRWIN